MSFILTMLTLCMLGNFAYFFVVCRFFFSKLTFSKNYFGNTIRVSNSLDPDQARHVVGSDLGPNCLQGYQQTTLGGKELSVSYSHLIFGHFNVMIFFLN